MEVKEPSAKYLAPPPYKQTEVGMIPDDWEVLPLSALCHTICDGTHFTPHYVAQGIPFYSVENVTANDFSNTKFISESEHALLVKRCRPERGDILMTRIGSLGDTKHLDWDVNASIYVSLALLKPNERVNPNYLYRYSKSKAFVVDVEKRSLLNASPKKINMGDIGAIPIPVPRSVREQKAIAEGLSDPDALIESLEQLLTKKRQLKQGAMQELLTGKKRLPRFSNHKGFGRCDLGSIPSDWDCIQLPSLMASGPSSIKIGPFGSALKKQHLTKEGFKVYGQENVYERNMDTGDRFINGEHFKKLRSCEVKAGDFLISMMGTVGKCMIVPNGIREGIMDSHLLRLRLDPEKLDSTFLAQLFETRLVFEQVNQLSVGGIMEGLSSKIIKSLKLPVPTVKEQAAIAEALREMDAEVATLAAKLTKARQLKQGMMQELLTGRVRLI